MLHIATVHFKSPRWIPIQTRELQRSLRGPYVTWASLEGIDRNYHAHFDHVIDHSGSHPCKLNRLASEIVQTAADDDLLMFLDGDAFPFSDPAPLIASGLSNAPLMAVRRVENANDPQPHPCFCVTRVATWRDLPGDWGRGMSWEGHWGEPVSDPGAKLLERLQLSNTSWTQVLRSNRHDLHPVFFGLYGDAIYHHGAGFRLPISRADLVALGADVTPDSPAVQRLLEDNRRLAEDVFRQISRDSPGWLAALR